MIIDEDVLEHYGVKGMKWGVRRIRSSKPLRTTAKRVEKTERIFNKVERAKANPRRPITNRARYGEQSLLVAGGTTIYTGKQFVKRVKKEYGGTSLRDIANGEGLSVTYMSAGKKKAKAFSSNISNRGGR